MFMDVSGQVLTPDPMTRIRAAHRDPVPLTMEDIDNDSIPHNTTNVKFQCTLTHRVECCYIWPSLFECEKVNLFPTVISKQSSEHLRVFSEQLIHNVLILVGYKNYYSKRLKAQSKAFIIINMVSMVNNF